MSYSWFSYLIITNKIKTRVWITFVSDFNFETTIIRPGGRISQLIHPRPPKRADTGPDGLRKGLQNNTLRSPEKTFCFYRQTEAVYFPLLWKFLCTSFSCLSVTCVYICVVEIFEWPSIACTERISAPFCRRSVAKVWRITCGVTFFVIPAFIV